jgi:chemotaxis protein methyltransferase CheR
MSVGASDFDYIAQLVWRRSAIVLEPGKEYLVESRLTPLLRRVGGEKIADLVARLQSAPENQLHSEVVDAMTTNETSWFRDRLPFDAMSGHILPEILEKRARERRLTIWSAGCSSGQEPYSIAMMLANSLAMHPGWSVQIIATDLSEEMLTKAKAGRYGQLEVNRGLPAQMLVSNFERIGMQWEVKEHIRQMVDFRPLNLARPFDNAVPSADVIFLRNVLIYFDTETKKQVLKRVRSVLRPDGYLFLGGAETTLNIDEAFEPVQFDRATCYRLRGGEVNR